MRFLLAICMFAFATNIGAEEKQIQSSCVEFASNRYELAFVDSGDKSGITNEYLQAGDTLDEWSSMIAVRQWPEIDRVSDLSGPYLEQVRARFVRNAQVFSPPPKTVGTDFILELYLAPPDHSYIEYNLIRFGKEPGQRGVKMYQYALRGPFNIENAVEFNTGMMESRFNELVKLQLETVATMPQAESSETSPAIDTQVE